MINTKTKLGIMVFGIMLLFMGTSNAQSISIPNNIYTNTTFPIIVNGLPNTNNSIGMLELNLSGTFYPVLYTNTTAESFGYLNATGIYQLSAIFNGSIIASTTINVSANLLDIISSNQTQDQENITNLTTNINNITASLNTTNTTISALNTSLSDVQTNTSNSINSITTSLNAGLNTMNSNSNLFSGEIANNTQLSSQTASLLSSYINNTNGELSVVASDLSNINSTATKINNTHNTNELLLFVGEAVLAVVVAYLALSSKRRKGSKQNQSQSIEQEIVKEIAKETKQENELNKKESLQASRFEALKKKKTEIQKDEVALAMQNDTELIKLKEDYLSLRDGAIKNKIPPQSLPEFVAYKNYVKKKYGTNVEA